MLFRWTPLSPANQPEPQPVEHVIEAAPPTASITLMWVVPRAVGGSASRARPASRPTRRSAPRRARARRAPPRYSARSKPAPRCACAERRACASASRAGRRERVARRRDALEHAERVGDQDARRMTAADSSARASGELRLHRATRDHAVVARGRGAVSGPPSAACDSAITRAVSPVENSRRPCSA